MPAANDRLLANLTAVRGRIFDAAQAAGRNPDDVRLVAVTKYVDWSTTARLAALGQLDLGESRPQQLWAKAALLAEPDSDVAPSAEHGHLNPQNRPKLDVRWHLIGHLQRNKIRRTLPLVHLVHSGDSERLLTELDREVAAANREPLSVLIEVNVSGDAAKHGFAPDEMGRTDEDLRRTFDRLAKFKHLDVRGLMCMAGLDDDRIAARRDFARLRELRDRMQRAWSGRFTLAELSMGMSGDFEEAIAEGATIVRVGSALFEGCDGPAEATGGP